MQPRKLVIDPRYERRLSLPKNCNLAPVDCILEIKRTLNDCQDGQTQTGRWHLSIAV